MTKSDLMRKLHKLNKIELIDLLLELNKKENKIFFDAKFKSLDEKSMKTIIEGYVKKAYVKGYVPASKAREAYEGVYIVLEKIMKVKGKVERIELLCHTINVVMNLNNIDDSYGDLSNIMSELLIAIDKEVIDRIGRYTQDESKLIIDVVFSSLKKENYYGINDYYYKVLTIITVLSTSEELYLYFTNYLDIVIKYVKNNKEDHYSKYELERVLVIKYYAMKFYNVNESCEFLKSNLHYDSFKKEYMEFMWHEEDFVNLTKYCKEIIKTGNRLLQKFAFQLLVRVGEKTENINLIRENAFKLLQQGEFRFYDTYKETFSAEEFKEKILNLLEFRESPHWRISIRNLVLIKENLQNIMIEDINKNPLEFFLYYEHLNLNSLNTLKDSYKIVILKQLSYADKRNKYKKVCRLIEQYAKDYQEYPLELIEEIEVNNYRKTALMDELGNLKRKLIRKY